MTEDATRKEALAAEIIRLRALPSLLADVRLLLVEYDALNTPTTHGTADHIIAFGVIAQRLRETLDHITHNQTEGTE